MNAKEKILEYEKRRLYQGLINELITPANFMQMVDYMCVYAKKEFPLESLYLTTHAPIEQNFMHFRFWKGRPKISESVHPDVGTQTDKFLGDIWPNRSKGIVLERIIRERYDGVTIVRTDEWRGEIEGDWSPCEPNVMKAGRDYRGDKMWCMQTTLYELVKGEKIKW